MWTEGQIIHGYVARRFFNPLGKLVRIFHARELGADETEHNRFAFRNEAQRFERPGAFVVIFEKEAIHFESAKQFGVVAPKIRAVATAEFLRPASRPSYSVLNNAKLERVFQIRPSPLRDSLTECLKRLFS